MLMMFGGDVFFLMEWLMATCFCKIKWDALYHSCCTTFIWRDVSLWKSIEKCVSVIFGNVVGQSVWKLKNIGGCVWRCCGWGSLDKRRRKCNCFKILEQFTGDNATCNVCLAYRKRWADKSPEIVKELWQKYHGEHREEIISKEIA